MSCHRLVRRSPRSAWQQFHERRPQHFPRPPPFGRRRDPCRATSSRRRRERNGICGCGRSHGIWSMQSDTTNLARTLARFRPHDLLPTHKKFSAANQGALHHVSVPRTTSRQSSPAFSAAISSSAVAKGGRTNALPSAQALATARSEALALGSLLASATFSTILGMRSSVVARIKSSVAKWDWRGSALRAVATRRRGGMRGGGFKPPPSETSASDRAVTPAPRSRARRKAATSPGPVRQHPPRMSAPAARQTPQANVTMAPSLYDPAAADHCFSPESHSSPRLG